MTRATHGRFVWYDHIAKDPEAAIAFYTHVFGWTTKPIGQGYTTFAGSQGAMAGTVSMPERLRAMGVPAHWSSNVFVDDLDASVAKVKELGGKVHTGPSAVPGVGKLATIGDPQMATINLFQPEQPQALHDMRKHGEFCWHELITSDHESAWAFYSRLFGWTKSRDFDMGPMGNYLIYGKDRLDLGGMFTRPRDKLPHPHWLYYVEVDALDAAIARAKEKGATVVNGPMRVPGGAKVAQLDDPQGTGFAVHESAKG